MIDKWLRWIASKRGFNLEPKHGLTIIHYAQSGHLIIKSVAAISYLSEEGRKVELVSLDGVVVVPGEAMKIYITRG